MADLKLLIKYIQKCNNGKLTICDRKQCLVKRQENKNKSILIQLHSLPFFGHLLNREESMKELDFKIYRLIEIELNMLEEYHYTTHKSFATNLTQRLMM